jgi:hypothetical protein
MCACVAYIKVSRRGFVSSPGHEVMEKGDD